MEQNKYISLSQLQNAIKGRLAGMTCWVKAEVGSYQISRGHHYFDLIEKGDNDTVAAKARAVVWASASGVVTRFEKAVGKRMSAGITLVMKVSVSYHAQFGLSLVISDIDASYTLGEREMQRKRTIAALESERLLSLQRDTLALPYLPGRIAVISSRDAAGFGDFTKHLAQNPYGFVFDCTLFHSLMQGDAAPSMIIDSFAEILNGSYDLVVLMRGGGADADMYCFDDYAMCKTIAQFPVPVLTAVGHEKDHHICDMVAFRDFKTPTALADALIEWVADVESSMILAYDNAVDALRARIDNEDDTIRSLCFQIKYALSQRTGVMETETASVFAALKRTLSLKVERMSSAVNDCLRTMKNALLTRTSDSENEMRRTVSTIRFALSAVADKMDFTTKLLDAGIDAADPRAILRQGYVLAADRDGRIVKSAASGNAGDGFSLRFGDGHWDCLVEDVHLKG